MSPAATLTPLRRAPESCRSSRNRKLSLVITLALTGLFSAQQAFAAGPLPQGGRFVGGAGSIAQSGANLNITQTRPRAIIEWDSF
ncbi:hypothetical protein LJ656_22685 [Paraburkholderia sp. MMS20-SJTR3]|uniref:Uncharacterized protein n=1 Tax=Paraburkholderia sejongensis TaxID=2886946 RepID=A0ABS8JZS8_9BURK|nr:hypothetical protein [Paraburkholderia sp. MMS20-SJTR3]MCC8395399.1 hypothetical protein [Paraburkholderia sp. MMS20-SJTR3]